MIKIDNIRKTFGSREVLKGVTLNIEKGKTTVIFGVSGGGKSTIIKHIIGLLKPDSGTIEIMGEKLDLSNHKALREIRKKVGFLFQSGALFDSMNVAENVAFALREHDKTITEEELQLLVDKRLKMVGLDPTIVRALYPDELSGGMRKRAGLARALMLKPSIILYDEPTSGLDPVSSDLITRMINRLRDSHGITSVLISHDIAESFKAGDNFAMLYEGKIVETGDKESFKNSQHPVVRQFIGASSEGPIKFN